MPHSNMCGYLLYAALRRTYTSAGRIPPFVCDEGERVQSHHLESLVQAGGQSVVIADGDVHREEQDGHPVAPSSLIRRLRPLSRA